MEYTSTSCETARKLAAQMGTLTADILAMPVARWKICCCTLDERKFLLSSPYEIPVQDTQKHVENTEKYNYIVTGISVNT